MFESPLMGLVKILQLSLRSNTRSRRPPKPEEKSENPETGHINPAFINNEVEPKTVIKMDPTEEFIDILLNEDDDHKEKVDK
jgi:hypothetical protein